MPEVRLVRALERWQLAAGPYWPYAGAAPFLGELQAISKNWSVATNVPRFLQPTPGERAIYFIDLPPTATLRFSPELNRSGFVVVPAIQRWCAPAAVAPCEDLVAQLCFFPRFLRFPEATRGVVFVLDGDRFGPRKLHGLAPGRGRFDNRYTYNPDHLPNASFLGSQQITRAIWIGRGPISQELRPYADELARAGMLTVERTIASPRL